MTSTSGEGSLPSRYDPVEVEESIYRLWEEGGHFRARVNHSRTPYTIMMPPPNVTSDLHVGHALNNTLQDVLIRRARMRGKESLWQPGTDHAGIATQRVVETHLREERGVTRYDLGRDEFIRETWRWKDRYEKNILRQLKRLGASPDWKRTRFTMDEGLSRAVQEVFIRLYEKGLIYRGDYLINWCIDCGTALSDIEVEHEERTGGLHYVHYPLADSDDYVLVATTRPETILGDTGMAVHPEDERYSDLIGRRAVVPLMEREIPIIADEWVDPEFGTGIVKVTPGHDPNDFEIGLRAELPTVKVIGEEGAMTEEAGAYAGMDRDAARDAVVQDLRSAGLLERVEEHEHAVGVCHRCHSVVEPLVSKQWFVRMKPLAEPAMEAVRDGRVRFVPERFSRVYLNWMENIRDWCISRQLWWGHQIPAWYCDDCDEVVVDKNEPTRCPHCAADSLRRDTDVLDTWFSSALWPFSTQGWPEDSEEMEYFFPGDVLVTAWDIIPFWVARMIFTSLEFTGEVPFKDVLIHGVVLDPQGRKMSKSLGNGVDPLEVIEEYGADALRFCLLFGNTPGNDMRFHWERTEAGRNFANKLWNACRFVLMHVDEQQDFASGLPGDEELETEDRWLLTRLHEVIEAVDGYFQQYQLGEALREIYDFAWSEYCDWYIEMVKSRLAADDSRSQYVALQVLQSGLSVILRLLHPFMPFVTEAMWQAGPEGDEELISASWPRSEAFPVSSRARYDMHSIMEIIRCIRNLRSEVNIPPSQEVAVQIIAGEEQRKLIEDLEHHVGSMARVNDIQFLCGGSDRPHQALAGVASDVQVFLPLRGIIDLDREIERLDRNLSEALNRIERSRGKLANSDFVQKAPQEVVDEERRRLTETESQAEHLKRRLAELRDE